MGAGVAPQPASEGHGWPRAFPGRPDTL